MTTDTKRKAQLWLDKLRAKSKGTDEERAPWYSRWAWLIALGVVFVVAFIAWSMAKSREASLQAMTQTLEEQARATKIRLMAERDQARAEKLDIEHIRAVARAEVAARELLATRAKRRSLEVALAGASSWEELEALEEGIE